MIQAKIERLFRSFPIVSLLGPRQCGKTTLARSIAKDTGAAVFDLEDPEDETALTNAMLVLGPLSGLVIIDEVQRRPELFPILRVLVDRPDNHARYLLLGSASPLLVTKVSESLAGRCGFVEMEGFSLHEIGVESWEKLWLAGSFPRAFLAEDEESAWDWRAGFTQAFLERDLPQLGIRMPSTTIRRFWVMTAHFNGGVWNAAELARSMSCSEGTARHYLDILVGTYVLRSLPPWHVNIGKRLVKSPKVYFRDTGLMHFLLGIRTRQDLWSHPKLGASWEAFAIAQILREYPDTPAYFYATHNGAELDLYIETGGKKIGFEVKLNQAPKFTPSMAVVLKDLSLDHLYVVYPGTRRYPLNDRTEVIPLSQLPIQS